MALPTGTRLGPYEVLTLVGVGGMGEVYRARDSRLGRTVAIKVIGSSFTDHEDMRRRFEEEGRFVAQLDHPRIGAIYDVGHDAGVDFLVMEFLEGRSLATRIAEGPVPVPELIGYAIEIAAALAYAHHRGVFHRDLKPGNILLTRSGVKIIDFGLGKLRQDKQRPSADMAALKTLPMTEPGVVPGTAQYMPPERLEGLEADHRSDIFAFGAILYEMATARRPFEASTPAALIAAILTSEPGPMFQRRGENDDLEWVVRRCLKKDPDERWQSMTDVEAVLKRIASTSLRSRAEPYSPARTWIGAIVAGTIVLLAIAALVVGARLTSVDAAAPDPIALTIPPPEGGGFTPTESSLQSAQLAVSPDGRSLAFVATGNDGVSSLWVRPVGATAAKMIPDTARATYPFWSPSNRSLGFFADGHLKRVDLDGGPSRVLAAAPNGRGGAWNADDVILFCPGTSSPIYRVSANGAAVPQTTLSSQRREMSHRWPQFLPDGRHFIYLSRSQDEESSGIFVASLDASETSFLVASGFAARYSPTGHLLYVADEALMMVPFDAAQRRLTGEPRPILDEIATASSFYSAFSVSRDVLAFAPRAGIAKLTWVGRDGRQLGTAIPPANYVDFQISPDGRHVAVAQIDPHADFSNVRVVDLKRGTNQLLTTSPATDASPVWSPDGTRIVFRSNRQAEHDLYLQSASGGDDAPFLKTPTAKYPTQWSPDGKFIVYHTFDDETRFDIWAVPVDHSAPPRPLVRTKADEIQGQISPNHRWLAYTSNISSRPEVYIQPMVDDGRKWPISVDGGSNPKWSADGRELFYLAPDNRLMSVEVGASDRLDPGTPRALFSLSDVTITRPFLNRWYDVDSINNRFLVRVPVGSVQTLPLKMYVHWSSLPRLSH